MECSCIIKVCDLQYLYAILALYMLEIFKFFMYYYIVPMQDCHVQKTYSHWVTLLHLIISNQCTQFRVQSMSGNVPFLSLILWPFFFREEVILYSLTSCFLRSRESSIYTLDVISEFLTCSIYSKNVSAFQYSQKSLAPSLF